MPKAHNPTLLGQFWRAAKERDLKKLGYRYIRKRQSKGETRRADPKKYKAFIKKEELARAVGACLLDPFEVRLGVNRLFEDDLYRKIFDGRPAIDYLTFYRLFRIASYAGRGDIRLGYAKWLRRAPELTRLCFPEVTQAGGNWGHRLA